jgi:imidazolonepropionase-like amidohydrolase
MRDNAVHLLFSNASFACVEKGAYFPKGTSVLVKDGKVESLLAPGEQAPADAKVVDLGGRSVIPGLVNPHVHLQMKLPTIVPARADMKKVKEFGRAQLEKNLSDCVDRGVTVVCDAVTEDLSKNRRLKERISSGELKGPRIVQCVLVSPHGGAFSPERGLRLKLLYLLAGMKLLKYDDKLCGTVVFRPDAAEQEIRDAVDRAIDERGANVIKFYDQREFTLSYRPGAAVMEPKQLYAAADQVRKRALASTMHHLTVESMRRGLAAGVTSLAHLPYDEALTPEDVRSFRHSECVLTPTLSLAYIFSLDLKNLPSAGLPGTELLAKLRRDTMGLLAKEFWVEGFQGPFLDGLKRAEAGKLKLAGFLDMTRVFNYYCGVAGHGADNMARLYEAGVELAVANDAGAVSLTPAMVTLEILLLSAFITRARGERKFCGADALRAATLNGARSIGLEKVHGSILPEKAADLVVMDGDPLSDPSLIGAPAAAVFIGGRAASNRCGLKM